MIPSKEFSLEGDESLQSGAGMNIVKEFLASGSRESLYELFQDVPSVAQCLPGAQITSGEGAGPFQGTVSVTVGPVSASFEGEAKITSNRSTWSGRIEGRGTDPRGGNRGELTMDYRLEPTSTESTRVLIDVEVELSGPIARFGRTGLINEIADQLIGDFSTCLDAKLSAETPVEAARVSATEIKGLRLIITSLFRWIGALLRRLLGRG